MLVNTWPGSATSVIVNFGATLPGGTALAAGLTVGPSSAISLFPSLTVLRSGSVNISTSSFYDCSFALLGKTAPGLVVPGNTGMWNFHWGGTGTATIETVGGFDDAYCCLLQGKSINFSFCNFLWTRLGCNSSTNDCALSNYSWT